MCNAFMTFLLEAQNRDYNEMMAGEGFCLGFGTWIFKEIVNLVIINRFSELNQRSLIRYVSLMILACQPDLMNASGAFMRTQIIQFRRRYMVT
jgi:hypothetical protein